MEGREVPSYTLNVLGWFKSINGVRRALRSTKGLEELSTQEREGLAEFTRI